MDKISIVILARKNSKRIPFKNMKLFCGKPLIHYTLETAIKFDYPVFLFTDYKELKEYVNDNFKTVKVIEGLPKFFEDKHILNECLLYYKDIIDSKYYILLQPTSPIRDFEMLKSYVELFLKSDKDAGYTVYKMPVKNYYINNNGITPVNFNQEDRTYSDVEKKDLYFENGAFYIFRNYCLHFNHILSGKSMAFVDKYGFDLDHPIQWIQAENFYKFLKEGANEN